jgi:hypothetical protein
LVAQIPLAYDKLDTTKMCSKDCQLQGRRNYKDYLAQNQETNFEYWKISGLSFAIPVLTNVDKSGPNHLKSLIF